MRYSWLAIGTGVLLLSALANAEDLPRHLAGPALVVDGDGLKIGQWEIRLLGIDAPEMREAPEGRRSRAALDDLIADRPVECDGLYFDPYHRVVAICRVEGRDLGEEMLAIGWAAAWPKYLEGTAVKDAYLDAERQARAARRGIWAE